MLLFGNISWHDDIKNEVICFSLPFDYFRPYMTFDTLAS